MGIPGSKSEFLAYRLLYLVFTENITGKHIEQVHIVELMSTLNEVDNDKGSVDENDAAISHALSVRSAVSMRNYAGLFRLFSEAPNMGHYIMANFIDRYRIAFVKILCTSVRPRMSALYLQRSIGIGSQADFNVFMQSHGIALMDQYDCKNLLEDISRK